MNILTMGVFDLPHGGHVELFKQCRELAGLDGGGQVVVGVNPDGFVLRYKGRLPYMSYEERRAWVEACRYVDIVVPTPLDSQGKCTVRDIIQRHNIKLIVVGSDWLDRNYLDQIGTTREELAELGVSVHFKPYTQGISTTQIVERIHASERKLSAKSKSTLAIVPCYNPGPMLEDAIRELDEYVAIDNRSSDFGGYANVRQVEPNMFGPSYEMGALLHAFTKYERPRYLAIQDSLLIHDKRMIDAPASLYENPPKDAVYAFAPITPCALNMLPGNYAWINAHFPDITEDELHAHNGVQYNSFSASREQIQALIDAGYLKEEHLARDKAGDEAWERVLGVAFARIGIPVAYLARTSQTDHPVFTKHFRGRP